MAQQHPNSQKPVAAPTNEDDARPRDGGVFSDEQVAVLQQSVKAFNRSPAITLRHYLMIGFSTLCGLLALGSAVFDGATFCLAFFMVGVFTWLCYVMIVGTASKSYLWGKTGQLILTGRLVEWLTGIAVLGVVVVVLVILDRHALFASMLVVSFVFALLFYFTLDRRVSMQRGESIERVENLLREMRRMGVEDESLRRGVCEHAGLDGEPLYEALFGYEATVTAREKWSCDAMGRVRRRHHGWRDPIVRWLDARIQSRTQRKHSKQAAVREMVHDKQLAGEVREVVLAKPQVQSTVVSVQLPSSESPELSRIERTDIVRRLSGAAATLLLRLVAAPFRFARRVLVTSTSMRLDRSARVSESQLSLLNARGEVLHGAPGAKSKQGAKALRLFRTFLATSFRVRASDLHFEPDVDGGVVRLRVDGSMLDLTRVSVEVFPRLLSLVKVLCDVDITKRTIVQEGHFSAAVPSRNVDYRVSFAPSVHGQKMVIRILDPATVPQNTHELYLSNGMHHTIRELLAQQAGMMLVCGPTGSGKTTTLYALLRDLEIKKRNVVTIEDPVEYKIDGITQLPVNKQAGNTFNVLLESVLRQDPDVILLGEIRDPQTARTAMQAAMTGHLVLSTVHAKDTLGAIVRLLDLEVEPSLLSSSLNLILAQRLVRRLCPACKAPSKLTSDQRALIGDHSADIRRVYTPVGCPRCLDTGYRGRHALFELLEINDTVRDLLHGSPGVADLRRSMQEHSHVTLRDLGWQVVVNGQTDVDEVVRVTA